MRDSPERDLAVAETLSDMAEAHIKELDKERARLRQVVRMCLEQFQFQYGKRERGWDAEFLMEQCGYVLGYPQGDNQTDMDERVTVCDKCLQVSCWQGLFMCDVAQNAGTTEVTRAELLRLGREHPDYFMPKQRRME